MWKKLVSLNLALAMLLALVLPVATATGTSAAYDQYLIVDGVEYDASVSNSGDGWSSELQWGRLYLTLEGYNSGAILTNTNLIVQYYGDNYVQGDSTYGLYSEKSLELRSGTNGSAPSSSAGILNICGGAGYEAICAVEDIYIYGEMEAQGGNVRAISASYLYIDLFFGYDIFAGEDSEAAVETEYTNQKYLLIDCEPYLMTLHGNGGTTAEGEQNCRIVFNCGTPGWIFLPKFKNAFTHSTRFLGWTDDENNEETFYSPEEQYFFEDYWREDGPHEAELYACWESEVNKGVFLEGYYGPNNSRTHVVLKRAGEVYTLPELKGGGSAFDGWMTESGEVLPGGTEIAINNSITLTAQFTPLTFYINGVPYDASCNYWNSYDLGWQYNVNGAIANLSVFENYEGGTIELPCDASISLERSLNGNGEKPAITVKGSASLTLGPGCTEIVLSGIEGAPAIAVDEELSFWNVYGDDKVILQSDGPAIQAGSVSFEKCTVYAGLDSAVAVPVRGYSGQRYVEIAGAYTGSTSDFVDLTGPVTVPEAKDTAHGEFVGWKVYREMNARIESSYTADVWYMPGEKINAESGITLYAQYLGYDRSRAALFLDGNGGATAQDSKRCINVFAVEMMPQTLPENPFVNPGYVFAGYNSEPDGSGIAYAPGDLISDDGTTLVYKVYVQWVECAHVWGACEEHGVESHERECGICHAKRFEPHNWTNGWCVDCSADGGRIRFEGETVTVSMPGAEDGVVVIVAFYTEDGQMAACSFPDELPAEGRMYSTSEYGEIKEVKVFVLDGSWQVIRALHKAI